MAKTSHKWPECEGTNQEAQTSFLAHVSPARFAHVNPYGKNEFNLEADFAWWPVWALTEALLVRSEWLLIRREVSGKLTYTLLNGAPDLPPRILIERSCLRYFVERTFQDAKSEIGWDELQAQTYRAWEHHLALTALALWFVAQTKPDWRLTYARDPQLLQQFEMEALPALSTANVRELLKAALPLPQLTPAQATELVVTKLVDRARSTSSRLRSQCEPQDSSQCDIVKLPTSRRRRAVYTT